MGAGDEFPVPTSFPPDVVNAEAERAQAQPLDRITVQQDISDRYPVFKQATLLLWADGRVTWEPTDKWAVDKWGQS